MEYYLIKFACYPEDEIKIFLLNEKKYDDWCIFEPQEGYKYFEVI